MEKSCKSVINSKQVFVTTTQYSDKRKMMCYALERLTLYTGSKIYTEKEKALPGKTLWVSIKELAVQSGW